MTDKRIETVLAAVMKAEGGYANHARDKGGETMYGITSATARAHGYNGPMASLTQEQAKQIYETSYIRSRGFDKIEHLGTMAQVVSAGVMSGKYLEIISDAMDKPITTNEQAVSAINEYVKVHGAEKFSKTFAEARITYYKGLGPDQWATFGAGWTNRVNAEAKLWELGDVLPFEPSVTEISTVKQARALYDKFDVSVETTINDLAAQTGRDAFTTQKTALTMVSQLRITPQQLSAAGIDMTKLEQERGLVPQEERARIEALDDKEKAKAFEGRKIIRDGDNWYDLDKAKIGDESKKLLKAAGEIYDGLTPEQRTDLKSMADSAIKEAEERAVQNAREHAIDMNRAAGLGDLDFFGALILALMAHAAGHPELAKQIMDAVVNPGETIQHGNDSRSTGAGGVTDHTTLSDENLKAKIAKPLEGSTLRGAIVELATRFEGMREVGTNGGDLVKWVNGYTGDPWCGGYVDKIIDTAFEQATGKPLTTGENDGVSTGRLSAAYYKHIAEKQGAYFTPSSGKLPKPGDVVFFSVSANNSGYHVGMVTKVENGQIHYTAGNESDMVVNRSYSVNNHRGAAGIVVGYADLGQIAKNISGVDIDASLESIKAQWKPTPAVQPPATPAPATGTPPTTGTAPPESPTPASVTLYQNPDPAFKALVAQYNLDMGTKIRISSEKSKADVSTPTDDVKAIRTALKENGVTTGDKKGEDSISGGNLQRALEATAAKKNEATKADSPALA